MDLKTRKQWCHELGKAYRLRTDAKPQGKNEHGGNLYSREDFCLATEQVARSPLLLTENQNFWQEVKRRKAAAQQKQLNKPYEQKLAEEQAQLDEIKGCN